ncbi:hypothetical protein BX616_010856 [Lobosporangium transversale]|uniref:DUF7905 domain-containing protein n=1 Tax=Lobosporangium transversale TaxID=64571 RepID=A0A1Y2GNE0_9FUNG|nr:hypothetical protein BCR41DRAFT_354679 [Lobosporangium transversale]KAF9910473.1 hypothetical protein BX616_010856 [Lobosporangium transversale]ORZ14326.1 hypothetical protein BCR41DRAFT_354679 [Lobosporangium transversale]|eukprot:XP_021880804.1 hypothetical protein BCR41DRAFT_354679 [Lobosporangium transversale]
MDPDDVGAYNWRSTTSSNRTVTTRTDSTECDDYWFVPPYADIRELQEQLKALETDSATHMVLNPDQERVEIWGPTACIQKAKQQLTYFASVYQDMAETKRKATKSKGWAKPERELTKAEKRKKERREKELFESQRYLNLPTEDLAFNHCIKWPKDQPIGRLLGSNLIVLNNLRTEFKCFIWLENADLIHVAGNDKNNVLSAMNRIKNYILMRTRPPIETVCHVLEKPSKLVEIELVPDPRVPYIDLPTQLAMPQIRSRKESNPNHFLRARLVAGYENLHDLDLQMAAIERGDTNSQIKAENGVNIMRNAAQAGALSQDDIYIQSMAYIENMTNQNITRIRRALETTLGQVQLLDREIQMRINIGRIRFLEYPSRSLYQVREMDISVLPDPRLITEFSPFLTDSTDLFRKLKARLSSLGQLSVIEPEAVWTLGVLKRGEPPNERPINVQTEMTFRDDGKVGLWNALVQTSTPLNIRVLSSEKKLSWTWSVTTRRRLELDKFSPEGKFVHQLSLDRSKGEDGKLVSADTSYVQLRHIRRSKKWLFVRDPWTIELTKDSFWTRERPAAPFQYLTLDTEPDQELYSVSMYRDSWTMRFSENPHLGVGQVSSWEPSDFVEGEESIIKTIEMVSNIRSMIEGLL